MQLARIGIPEWVSLAQPHGTVSVRSDEPGPGGPNTLTPGYVEESALVAKTKSSANQIRKVAAAPPGTRT